MPTWRAPHLPEKRWLRLVLVATALVLVADAVYVYGLAFHRLVHSDAACTVLIAKKALDARSLVAPDWYFANGDVWVWGPQLWAMVPVAVSGIGLGALRLTNAFGFALELAALAFCYRRLTRRLWLAVLAAVTTLLCLSKLHVLFVYVELSYGFSATTYIVIFTLLTPVGASSAAPPWRRWLAGAAFLFFFTLQNPPRVLLFGLAPLLAAAVWPWRNVALRSRLVLGGLALGAWSLAALAYKLGFEPRLTFSPHPGHLDFVFQDVRGVLANVAMFGRGLVAISGELEGASLRAIPGLIVILGAFGLVVWRMLASRALTRERFLCVAACAQLGVVLAPCLLGNLLLNPLSARYVLPAFLPMMGLAVLFAVRIASLAAGPSAERAGARRWLPRAAVLWLALLPVVGGLGFFRAIEGELEGANLQWANRRSHADLARELSRRGLTHGFASYWNANLVTLLSNGATKTCSVFFGDTGVLPQKWNVDVPCFDRARMPRQVYVVAAAEEREVVREAVRIGLPPPIERFELGDAFEVSVFDIGSERLPWLDLPLPINKSIRYPFRLEAKHGAVRRGRVVEIADGLEATGAEDVLVYGPHLRMAKGRYTLRWIGSWVSSPGGELVFDVSGDGGAALLAVQKKKTDLIAGVDHAQISALDFELATETSFVEFRVFARGGAKVVLHSLVVEKKE